MSLSPNNSVERFAQRMERRANVLEFKVDQMMRTAFESIANIIFLYNPVWSSQSVVNWTASIGYSPKTRLVNVDRSNAGIKGGKFVGNSEGNMSNITPHNSGPDSIASLAVHRAARAAIEVGATYKRRKNVKGKSASIWLTNSISYTGDLWSGTWPTNRWRGGLGAVLDKGVQGSKHIKVWRF